jgi:signal peptidase
MTTPDVLPAPSTELGTAPVTGEDVPDDPRGRPGPAGAVLSGLLGVVMVAVLALAAAVVAVPRLLGAVPLTVLTGSMEPTHSPGDVVVVQPVDTDRVDVGDVITFQPVSGDPTLVTHRVVGVLRADGAVTGFVTRGDANPIDDDPILPDQVMGRVVYSIPLVGHLTSASWGPAVATAGAIGLIAYGGWLLVVPDRSRDTRSRDTKGT